METGVCDVKVHLITVLFYGGKGVSCREWRGLDTGYCELSKEAYESERAQQKQRWE